jgi:hypothetical protein
MTDRLTSEQLRAKGVEHHFSVTNVFNTTAAASGEPIAVVGYTLRGVRGNKLFLDKGEDGCVSAERLQLWLDCVAYAGLKIKRRSDGEG